MQLIPCPQPTRKTPPHIMSLQSDPITGQLIVGVRGQLQDKNDPVSVPSHGDSERPRQPEIRKLKFPLPIYEKILRLEVSVKPAKGIAVELLRVND